MSNSSIFTGNEINACSENPVGFRLKRLEPKTTISKYLEHLKLEPEKITEFLQNLFSKLEIENSESKKINLEHPASSTRASSAESIAHENKSLVILQSN